MNPKTLGALAAAIAAVGAISVDLAVDEAVDVDASIAGEHVVIRCKRGAKEGELDCGDIGAAKLHMDTASQKYLAVLAAKGATADRSDACACGPVAKSDCMVTTTGIDGKSVTRAAIAGEYLAARTWSGACPSRPCWELSEVIAAKGLGYSLPIACGGKPPAVKVVEDPAVEEKEVLLP